VGATDVGARFKMNIRNFTDIQAESSTKGFSAAITDFQHGGQSINCFSFSSSISSLVFPPLFAHYFSAGGSPSTRAKKR